MTGDRYAGEWVSSEFRQHGVRYIHAERNRSQIYVDCLPLLNAKSAVLLDDPRLIAQFAQLERRTGRTGDLIDHPGAVPMI